MDNAPVKRVELHCHTNMSMLDAIPPADEIVALAKKWGMKAVAITDHGNVQSFPIAAEAVKDIRKNGGDLKVIYGMEGYFVDDTARAIFGEKNSLLEDEFVVFDIETTGLSPINCGVTEIGAVRIRDGRVIEAFNTFVDPEMPIPATRTEITGITDDMVAGAPKEAEAFKAFMEFAGDDILIAHNAGFDTSFMRRIADDNKLPFENTYLDTVALSRYLNPELKKHKLDTLADYYKLGDFNHHRASDDAEMLAHIFFKMCEKMKKEGIRSTGDIIRVMADRSDPKRLRSYHIIILVKNLTGLMNLYKLITKSYLQNYYRHPRITKSELNEHRDGLIIGSACESGELFSALVGNRSYGDLMRIANFYDYLEIQPLSNNGFMIDKGLVKDEEGLKYFNREIVKLGEKVGKPVVATCDAHFINDDDEILRKILLTSQKFKDSERNSHLYFRTTEEMLEEFAYLGEKKAYEVVVENTNKIADQIEDIIPIPEGTYTPKMEGAEEDLQRICYDTAHSLFGDPLPDIVEKRLKKELDSIISNGFAVLYMIAQKLVKFSEDNGYLVGSRGSVGSSFTASMAGISEVSPLPPHYRCPKCKFSEFFTDGSVGSGFDLPDKNCPKCGEKMIGDGHDIPFETFLGFKGDKSPDIDLNFSGDVQGKVHKYTEELFGKENVFRAGTIGSVAEKTAYGYVIKYAEEKGFDLTDAEKQRLINGLVGIKRTTGQHPGGIIVVPREYDVHMFTPLQHPADKASSDIITTHFAFTYLHDTILKLDELGHDIPTKYKYLEKYSGIDVETVPMNDRKVMDLFLSTKPLGVSEELLRCKVGTYGLPEFGTRFVQQVIVDTKPTTFADLLQLSGLTHGTDVWLGNGEELIKNGTCTIKEVIGTRDNIMLYLIHMGMDNALAFKITEDVRKGRGLKPEYEEAMLASNVPQWYLDSCNKIKYMFPKAHAAAYVMSAIRLAWFKVYMPKVFYAAYFSAAPGGFDASYVTKGKQFMFDSLVDFEERSKKKKTEKKEDEMIPFMQLANECMQRDIEFLPVDLYKSHATAFLPEDDGIRLPFSTLAGLGENAAKNIMEACANKDILSVEDLTRRAGLTKTVVAILDDNHVLDDLQDTDQVTLFGSTRRENAKKEK
ncbi:MAG: PolC-type DNA polymerase III, partial [Clostridia bacterium]|nr:PolC-type DNA polymerase III [Clostridia bacterium]